MTAVIDELGHHNTLSVRQGPIQRSNWVHRQCHHIIQYNNPFIYTVFQNDIVSQFPWPTTNFRDSEEIQSRWRMFYNNSVYQNSVDQNITASNKYTSHCKTFIRQVTFIDSSIIIISGGNCIFIRKKIKLYTRCRFPYKPNRNADNSWRSELNINNATNNDYCQVNDTWEQSCTDDASLESRSRE